MDLGDVTAETLLSGATEEATRVLIAAVTRAADEDITNTTRIIQGPILIIVSFIVRPICSDNNLFSI